VRIFALLRQLAWLVNNELIANLSAIANCELRMHRIGLIVYCLEAILTVNSFQLSSHYLSRKF
jgi:hypothetical protein